MKFLRTIIGAFLGLALTVAYFIFMKQVAGMPGTMLDLVVAGLVSVGGFATAGWHWPLVRKLI